jgi:hypothetical protein
MTMTLFIQRTIFATLMLFSLSSLGSADKIIYTKTDNLSCKISYSDENSSEQICPAPAGWKIKIIDSGALTWHELRNERHKFNTLNSIISIKDFETFPHIAGDKIEWHILNNKVTGVIFRMSAFKVENTFPQPSALFIFKPNGNSLRFCGKAKTNTEARKILRNAKNCLLVESADLSQ